MKVEATKPKKEPKAALVAVRESLLLIISPIKAPPKAPRMIPKGIGIKIPTIKPTVAPIMPCLLPPKYFEPRAGITYCKTTTRIVTTKVIPKKV